MKDECIVVSSDNVLSIPMTFLYLLRLNMHTQSLLQVSASPQVSQISQALRCWFVDHALTYLRKVVEASWHDEGNRSMSAQNQNDIGESCWFLHDITPACVAQQAWHSRCGHAGVAQQVCPAGVAQQVWRSRCGPASVAEQVWPSRCGAAGMAQQVWPSRCGAAGVAQQV